jgi:hypothetical protein
LYAFAYNPAGLADVRRTSFILDYMHYVLDMNRGLLGFSLDKDRLKGIGTLGGYINYFHAGTFEAVDPEGKRTPAGDFTAGSSEIGLSYAREAPALPAGPLSWGLTLKWISDRIADYRNDAVGMDAGVQAFFTRYRIRAGAVLRNLGGLGTYGIPRSYGLGLSYTTKAVQQTVFMLDYNQPAYGAYTIRLGAEFRVNRDFSLRGGYRFLQPEVEHWYHLLKGSDEEYVREDFNSWSAGAGLKMAKRTVLDVAVLGNSFQSLPVLQFTFLYSLQK